MFINWLRKNNGTGSVLATVKLALDEGSETLAEFFQVADPNLTKYEVRAHFFPDITSSDAASYNEARRLTVRRLDELKVSLQYRPSIVRTGARGISYIPNIHNNFGDLVMVTASGPSVILDNCCLFDSNIVDDVGVNGVTLSLVFARVADAVAPSA